MSLFSNLPRRVFYSVKQWLYRGGHPNWIAKALNWFWARVYASGKMSEAMATLEVVGRQSGRIISMPVVIAQVNGQRYLVSMLGNEAQWVRNVRAAHGNAVIRSGKREEIVLEDVPVTQRAPIIKAYLQRADGARPHIPVDKDAPLAEFEKIAQDFPAFRIVPK